MNPVCGFWQKYPDDESEVLGKAYLEIDPASAAKARAYVREWIGADHPAYENARLATSELVTNAVVHARRRHPDNLITLTLTRRADSLFLEVLDPGGDSWRPPAPGAVPADEEYGRGLGIVGEISRKRWGVRDQGDLGRTVWCAIDQAAPPCG